MESVKNGKTQLPGVVEAFLGDRQRFPLGVIFLAGLLTGGAGATVLGGGGKI